MFEQAWSKFKMFEDTTGQEVPKVLLRRYIDFGKIMMFIVYVNSKTESWKYIWMFPWNVQLSPQVWGAWIAGRPPPLPRPPQAPPGGGAHQVALVFHEVALVTYWNKTKSGFLLQTQYFMYAFTWNIIEYKILFV